MSNLIYNDAWLITLSNLNNVDMSDYTGPFSGNGKIGIYGSMSNISTQKTYISGNLTFNQIGKYRNNMIEGFNMNTLKFIHNINSNISYDMLHQTLDISQGSIASHFIVSSNNVPIVDITHTLTPLRQYPYCIMQNVSFTMLTNMQSMDLYHEITGDPRFINDMDFQNNVIYNERIYDDKGLYILNGNGNINRIGQDGKTVKVAGASCYFFENSNNVRNLGFNTYNDLNSCYQKHRFIGLESGDVVNFHILGAQMTSMDFSDPIEEIKRILLNIAFKNENIPTLITQIASDNLATWDKLWQSDIILEPKAGITTQEAIEVKRVKQFIRRSLFNIFCCIRDGINTEVNPLNLSYLDANGNIFFDGDLWMVPVLLFLKPAMAKTILEFRYKNLEQATQLAASFGYKGSKFPYQNDVLGYQSMYWDVISPLHIFNNALIAINTWNYYRVTLDKEWLSTKGYSMMRNIADFLVSVISIDALTGNYNMNNTVGMSERVSDNHAFTVYMAKFALKCTIEASYELNYAAKPAWTDCFLNVDIKTFSGNNCSIIKYDDAYAGENVDVLDNLLILNPYYSSLYFNPAFPCRDGNAIQNNINYYAEQITPTYQNDTLNNLIIASLLASSSQNNASKLSDFYTKLNEMLDTNATELWGYFGRLNNKTNDVSLSAFFVMMFLTNIGGLSIKGGVTESKFYYEEFGIRGSYNGNMPSIWKNIKLKGIGTDMELFNVVNNIYYP